MSDSPFMLRALEIAERGLGSVEPNPLVGCTLVHSGEIVGEGWHPQYGGPHAEIVALERAGKHARGSTAYVTLEPCCHHGKTPPCTRALIAAGVVRVVAAMRDPFPQVSGGGIRELTAAGIDVEVGLHEQQARELNAPYLKLLGTRLPWVIAKWAMTLDGKIATASGASRWISGEQSRAIVQDLRGRVDAIVVGRGTAEADDPLLTARPASGSPRRIATRIVVDSDCRLASTSQLVKTVAQAPVLVACGPSARPAERQRLTATGCEVLQLPANDRNQRLQQLLAELGRRRMTNVLVEGGAKLLGGLFDARHIDEVHAFIAPLLFGGAAAPSPLGCVGISDVGSALRLRNPVFRPLGPDIYICGQIDRAISTEPALPPDSPESS